MTATNTGGNATATSATSEVVIGTRITEYVYSADGLPESVTGPDRHKTKYTYNADNQLTKAEAPNGTATETEYDANGNVTAQTDGNKHTTKYTRNALEEVTEVTDPLGHKTTKEYEAAGNLKGLTNPLKQTTTYTYDPANRLMEIKYSDGKTPTVKYEYDKDGDLTTMADGTGTTTYTYDQLDRLTEAETGHKEKVKYEYDLANEQTKVTYPNGKAVTRAYDNDGRLEKITDWLEHAIKFAHDPDSSLTTITYPTTTTDEDKYTYNDDDEISEVRMLKGTETLASLAYTRDDEGQLQATTSKGLPGVETIENSYDADDRLTNAGSTAYEYDAANNPTKLGSGSYKYNSADQLETGPSVTYSYNEQDERTKAAPTSGPATTYGYDEAENLTTVERPKEGEVAKIEDSYTYNGEGLRASQTISGSTSYLTWDTSEELPLLLNDGTNSYIYGPAGLPLEQINNSTAAVLYLHHDQAGSTRLLTGSTGNDEATFSYGAYGEGTGHTGTATTPLGYDGQYTSNDTGLIYLRAREYDPSTAQFLSVDPAVAVTEEPYSYAEDDPINREDRSGLASGAFGLGSGSVGFGSGFSEEGIAIPCVQPFCGALPSIPQAGKEAWEGAEWIGKGVAEGAKESYEATIEGLESIFTQSKASEEVPCQPGYTGDQDALIKIAKRAKRTGVSREEADILQEWAKELEVPFRGPETHPGRPGFGSQPHVHVGSQGHIPVR